MHTEAADTRHVLVRTDSGAYGLDVEVVPERLELRWRSVDIDGLHGAARVQDAPAGGSVVDSEVTVPGGAAARERAEGLLAEAMRHLQRDVSDNFNAG